MADETLERIRMTADEYRTLPISDQRTELLEGELIVSPAPLYGHQAAVFETAKLVERLAGGGTTVISPMDVYINDVNVVQPDVFWVRGDDAACVLRDGYWYGAPDLVIEIISPSTAARDRGFKYELYERSGVREYWLVDYEAHFIEGYVSQEGKFTRHGVFSVGQSFVSPVLDDKTVEVDVLLA